MKNLPIVAKGAINIILYLLYVVLAWFILGMLFPLILQMFGQEVIDPSMNKALFDKMATFIAIFILLVSLILRKHFYFSCSQEENKKEEKESYTAKKKVTKKVVEIEQDDDDIRIYVDKEIK